MKWEEHKFEIALRREASCKFDKKKRKAWDGRFLERNAKEGESPVRCQGFWDFLVGQSRAVWEYSSKSGGKHHRRLNKDGRPIAKKYREGKMKSTLKRG